MNNIKRFSGILWMLLGPLAIYVLLNAVSKILDVANQKIISASDAAAKLAAESARSNTLLQWSIMIGIFIPIMVGLVIFGYFALKGDYDHLPHSSAEITDY
jgi:hypothetical protein